MQSLLSDLVSSLRRAVDLEHGAGTFLHCVLHHLSETVAASSFAPDTELLQATLHLRPDDGYRGLFTRALRPGQADAQMHASALAASSITSATLWRAASSSSSKAELRCEQFSHAGTGASAPGGGANWAQIGRLTRSARLFSQDVRVSQISRRRPSRRNRLR